jgi:hypothetical protein
VFSLISAPVLGRENETDFQTWMDFRTIYDFNEEFTYDGNYGIRGLISDEEWRRYYIHPSLIYYYKINLRLRGGIRFIFTEEYTTVNTFEIRPWQGISLNWPQTSYFTINNYIRMEQRFTTYSNDTKSDFVLRFRYRIQAKTPTITITAINQSIYFLANYEIFLNIGEAVAEKYVTRRRISLAMGFYFSNSWWLEFVYALQGSRRDSEDGFNSREHVLRFRLRFKIN